jgi:hypothetical protein
VIRKGYSLKFIKLIRRSLRFNIILVVIFLAIIFTIIDILLLIISGFSSINRYILVLLISYYLADYCDKINLY